LPDAKICSSSQKPHEISGSLRVTARSLAAAPFESSLPHEKTLLY